MKTEFEEFKFDLQARQQADAQELAIKFAKHTKTHELEDVKDALLSLCESLQSQIQNRCASKEELRLVQPQLEQFCLQHFSSQAFVKDIVDGYDQKIAEVLDQSREIATVQE